MRNGLVAIALSLFIPLPAHALLLGFDSITNNNLADASIGETQLFVNVTGAGDHQVLFQFGNTGSFASSICDVYFDDGSLLSMAGIAWIDNSSNGVSFSQDARPGNLPGGNNASPPFVTTAGFSADSDPEVQPNGVNPGESLGIIFDLEDDQTFSNVLAELASGDLRIGIHVQGFDSGGSESFVNSIPDPATVFLLGSACLMGGLAGFRRKFRK